MKISCSSYRRHQTRRLSSCWGTSTTSTSPGKVAQQVVLGRKVAQLRRNWGCWWMKSCTWASNAHLHFQKANHFPGCIKRRVTSWLREVIVTLCPPVTPHGMLHPALNSSEHKSKSREQPEKWSKGRSTSPKRAGWENCSAQRREASEETSWPPSSMLSGLIGKLEREPFLKGLVMRGTRRKWL